MRKRRWLACIAALLFTPLLSAQFVLTEQGFTDSGNNRNYYLVQEFPGKTQRELYQACIAQLTAMRHTSDLFFDGLPMETVTVSQYIPEAVFYARMFGMDSFMDVDFTITFRFKDGKIRTDSPIIKELFARGMKTLDNGAKEETRSHYWISYRDYLRSPWGGTPIYNRKGRLKEPRIRQSLEDVMNAYIIGMMGSIYDQLYPDEW